MPDWVIMEWNYCKAKPKKLMRSIADCIRSVFPAARLAGKLSFREDGIPSQISCLHHAAQRLSQIRRDRMPVMQSVFRHNEFAVRIEHNEIRIVSRGNSTFARCRNRPVGPAPLPSSVRDRAT